MAFRRLKQLNRWPPGPSANHGHPGTRGLIGWWTLAETGTRVTDLSGYNFNGSSSATTGQPGPLGKSAFFNSNSVTFGTPPARFTVTDLTLIARINYGTTSMSQGRIIDTDFNGSLSQNDYGVLIVSNQAYFYASSQNGSNDFVQAGPALNDGLWHTIVCTRSIGNGALVVYVDGKQVGSKNGLTYTGSLSPLALFIGTSGVGFGFLGNISDCRILSRAATSAEAAMLSANPLAWLVQPKFNLRAGPVAAPKGRPYLIRQLPR